MTDFMGYFLPLLESQMAIKIDLHPDTARVALEAYLASLKRQFNTTKQAAFKPILDREITLINTALGSIVEVSQDPQPTPKTK